MAAISRITELDILAEVVLPNEPTFPVEVSRAMLDLHFGERARRRIEELLARNRSGDIAIEDRFELEKYLRVGQFLDLLHAKARLSLKHCGVEA